MQFFCICRHYSFYSRGCLHPAAFFSVSSVSVGCVYCLAAPVLCLQGYVLISVTVNKCFPGSQDFHGVVGNEVVQH